MAAKKQTYEQAMKRLEEIVSRIDSNELDIDSLSEKLKEAQELIKFCRDKLYKADEELICQCGNVSICQCAMRMRYVPHGTLTNYYFTTS